MNTITYLSISAVAAMLPSLFYSFRSDTEGRFLFWCFWTVAVAGSAALTIVIFSGGWRTGFAQALWATITATLVIYAPVAALCRDGYKLMSGLVPYLIVLSVLAIIWQNQPERPFLSSAPNVWVLLHIAFSLTTYALLTLAAISGFAAFVFATDSVIN